MTLIKKLTFLAFVLLLSAALPGRAIGQQDPEASASGQVQTLTLKDGSKVKGYLLDVEGEHYLFRTLRMGDLKVRTADVLSIATEEAPLCPLPAHLTAAAPSSLSGTSADPAAFAAQVKNIQQQYFSNPQFMASLQELANDPEIVKMLSDPQLLQAVLSMNPQQIMNDPQAQQLYQNPKIQSLIQQVGQQMGASPGEIPQP